MKIRFFKSSGGAILLLWEFCVTTVIYKFYNSIGVSTVNYAFFAVGIVAAVFIFSSSSILADVVFGRYEVIKCSLFIVWVMTMMQSIASIVIGIYEMETNKAWIITLNVFKLLSMVGCGAFLVNSLHFGIDQLMDAPSWQLSSFISWYCWGFFVTDVLYMFFLKCTVYPWSAIGTGSVACMITIAICLDFLYHDKLIKEPTSPNPLKLICSVLHFAKNNRYPRARSAFSCWDEKKSRINFSKSKYGGPFTNEEVEDVKSFLRMLGVIVIGSLFTGYFIVFSNTENYLYYRFQDNDFKDKIDSESSYGHCLVRRVFHQGSSFIIFIFVPLAELILFPLFPKLHEVTSFTKFKVGMLFLFLNQLGFLTIDISGYLLNHNNATLPCLLESSKKDLLQGNTYSLSFYWLGIPKVFSAIAFYFIFISTTEFLCAQSPYSMKGLLQGLTYSFVSFFTMISVLVRLTYKTFKWHSVCGILYFLVSTVVTLVLIMVVIVLSKWYSRRRRRENAHDEIYNESNTCAPHRYATLTDYQ